MKKLLFVIAFLFGGFILWMNLTSGHFQEGCCGEVHYVTVTDCHLLVKCAYPSGFPVIGNQGLLFMAKLDFNP